MFITFLNSSSFHCEWTLYSLFYLMILYLMIISVEIDSVSN